MFCERQLNHGAHSRSKRANTFSLTCSRASMSFSTVLWAGFNSTRHSASAYNMTSFKAVPTIKVRYWCVSGLFSKVSPKKRGSIHKERFQDFLPRFRVLNAELDSALVGVLYAIVNIPIRHVWHV
eukprot:6212518-Pleurochrysis_carterae.AAC.9